MAFVNEVSENILESRTVDYERGAVLRTGAKNTPKGRGGPNAEFTITWKDQDIEFACYRKTELFEPDGSKGQITYHVLICMYPDSLEPFKAEIIQLVVDGLMAFGVNYGSRDGTEVVVRIDPYLGSLQMEPIQDMAPSPEVSKNIH